MRVHVGSFFDGPRAEFVHEFDETVHCRFKDDFAFFGGPFRRVAVNAGLSPAAPVVIEADEIVHRAAEEIVNLRSRVRDLEAEIARLERLSYG